MNTILAVVFGSLLLAPLEYPGVQPLASLAVFIAWLHAFLAFLAVLLFSLDRKRGLEVFPSRSRLIAASIRWSATTLCLAIGGFPKIAALYAIGSFVFFVIVATEQRTAGIDHA